MKENYKFVITDDKVIALSSFAGRTVRGVAKCHPNDKFDVEYGKALAAARCGVKIAKKRYARARDKYDVMAKLVVMVDKEFKDACEYYTNSYEKLHKALMLEDSVIMGSAATES